MVGTRKLALSHVLGALLQHRAGVVHPPSPLQSAAPSGVDHHAAVRSQRPGLRGTCLGDLRRLRSRDRVDTPWRLARSLPRSPTQEADPMVIGRPAGPGLADMGLGNPVRPHHAALLHLQLHLFPGSAWDRTARRLCLHWVRGEASSPVRCEAEPGNEGISATGHGHVPGGPGLIVADVFLLGDSTSCQSSLRLFFRLLRGASIR